MNIVEKLRLMQTDHIPELGEAISEIEHLRREVHAWSKACEDATTKLYKLSTHDRDKIIAQQARIEQLTNFIKHAQVSSGVCCCGDSMEGHPSPMTCGHSPVDMWDYHSGELLEAYPDDLSALRAHDEKLRAVFQAGAASRDASG